MSTLGIAVGAFALSGVAAATALVAQETPNPSSLTVQPDFLRGSSFADLVGADQISVDFSQDPEAAQAFLQDHADDLDGYTVYVTGIDVLPGDLRSKHDKEAVENVPTATYKPIKDEWSCAKTFQPAARPRAFVGCESGEANWIAMETNASAKDELSQALAAGYHAALKQVGAGQSTGISFAVVRDTAHTSRSTCRAPSLARRSRAQVCIWSADGSLPLPFRRKGSTA